MKNLDGKRFGRLTVVHKTETRKSGRIVWECICDCGNTCFATTSHLTTGQTTSCGCARKGVNAGDLAGRRFGRLVALAPIDARMGNSVMWACKCDCGKSVNVAAISLTSGGCRSCGCLASEAHRKSFSAAMERRAADYIDGTDLKGLAQAPSARNTSGKVGVSWDSSVKLWRADITFKGRRHRLGSSADIREAAKMRQEAEDRLHLSFLYSCDAKTKND